MKRFLTTFFAIFFIINCSGQDPHKVDSLKKLLAFAGNDTMTGLAIAGLASEYLWSRPDSCLLYLEQGLNLIKNKIVEEKFNKSDNPVLYSFALRMYGLSGVALSKMRNDSLAVKMIYKSMELAKNSSDKYDMHRVNGVFAEVYQNIDEPKVAAKYIRLNINGDTSATTRKLWQGLLGIAYFKLGNYDSAAYYLDQIDPHFKQNSGLYWPYAQIYRGRTYAKKGDYNKAIFTYRVALELATENYLPVDICEIYLSLGEAFHALAVEDSAFYYGRQSFQLASALRLPEQRLGASNFLYPLFEAYKMKDSAYKYLLTATSIKDSLNAKEKIKEVQNLSFAEKLSQLETEEKERAFRRKIILYIFIAGIAVLTLFAAVLIRNNRQKQTANRVLLSQKEKIELTLSELKSTQAQLVQSEKMASLVQLTSGIAHEIQNPLNFVNNFSDINKDLINELIEAIDLQNYNEAKEIAAIVRDNEDKISNHGKRADTIIKGMLQHSHHSTATKSHTELNPLIANVVRLVYQGFKKNDPQCDVIVETELDPDIKTINMIPHEISQVMVNLLNNSFYAIKEKKKLQMGNFEPLISIKTRKMENKVTIEVTDNGIGIQSAIINKIFQPFFTTKPTGQGTGLGLSITYDIIKAHEGEIQVESKEMEQTRFKFIL